MLSWAYISSESLNSLCSIKAGSFPRRYLVTYLEADGVYIISMCEYPVIICISNWEGKYGLAPTVSDESRMPSYEQEYWVELGKVRSPADQTEERHNKRSLIKTKDNS